MGVVIDPFTSQDTYLHIPRDDCAPYSVGVNQHIPVWEYPKVPHADNLSVFKRDCLWGNCSLCGAHALLVRKSGIDKLLAVMDHEPALPLDWIFGRLPGALAWKPHVAMSTFGPGHPNLPSACDKKILLSTIG